MKRICKQCGKEYEWKPRRARPPAYCSEGCRKESKYASERRWIKENLEKHRETRRRWVKKNPEKIKKYRSKRGKSDIIYSRKYREEHPEWKKENNRKYNEARNDMVKEYRARYPRRIKANVTTGKFIRGNEIERQPCSYCGSDKNIVAHHPDHSRWYEIVWLCQKCHKRLHAEDLDFDEQKHIVDLGKNNSRVDYQIVKTNKTKA